MSSPGKFCIKSSTGQGRISRGTVESLVLDKDEFQKVL